MDAELSTSSEESLQSNSESSDEGQVLCGAVRPYEHEPLADSSDADDEDSGSDNDDEDGISPATLEARYEQEIPLDEW
ncbi:hypothetical protein QZH41_000913 [Actinostola sp. cb2023]|nr:hypothetical protein QZH41_000913 [Actinostola sp. cb2023]